MVNLTNVISGLGKALPGAVASRQQIELGREELLGRRADALATLEQTRRTAEQNAIKDAKLELEKRVTDFAADASTFIIRSLETGAGDPATLLAVSNNNSDAIAGYVSALNEQIGRKVFAESEWRKLYVAKVQTAVNAVRTPQERIRMAEQQGVAEGAKLTAQAGAQVAAAQESPAVARAMGPQFQTPVQIGAEAAAQKIAAAEAVINRPLSDDERQAIGLGAEFQTMRGEDDAGKPIQIMALLGPDGRLIKEISRGPLQEGVAPTTNINVATGEPFTPYEKEFAGTLAKADLAVLNKANEDAEGADATRVQIGAFRNASGGFETGAFGDLRAGISRLASLFKVGLPDAFALGNPISADVMQSAEGTFVLQFQSIMKGSTSNKDVETAKKAVPSLLKTPEGNVILLEIRDRVAVMQQRRRDFFNQYLDEHNGQARPRGEKNMFSLWSEFAEANPIIDEELEQRIRTATGGVPRTQLPPAPLPREDREVGRLYAAPDGRTVKWNGRLWEVVP